MGRHTSRSAGVRSLKALTAFTSPVEPKPSCPFVRSITKALIADTARQLDGSLRATCRSARILAFSCSSRVATFFTRFLGAGFLGAAFFFAFGLALADVAFFAGFFAGLVAGLVLLALVAVVFLAAGLVAARALTAFFTVAVGFVAAVVVA
jgi:hypothetical protein